ncbi:efflux RND transporter periplasmic adaptor subunit [Aquibium sp. A9E412]|uniref:efflux RND transporter periplasmic adaptor subunit n=1 Tax=Aquibium sp. A9E412 TaxID=2976767 RepID=UPI0025AED2F3|nr:efflux RND transporter periplasmic adaptor subunit [Aquibium sp. A9E412]MDN2567828.1 efflux RND transporter periplasmic adaptor subunit [Aquibium sp. A9E412]
MKTIAWLLASLAVLALGAAGFWWLSRSAPQGEASAAPAGPPLVEVARARAPEATPEIVQTGFVRPVREVAVAFEVQGRIRTVAPAFAVGAAVAEGTVLASLDPERLAAAVERAEADLAAAEAQLAEADAALERQATLEERDVVSEAGRQDAAARRASAAAQVAVARAALRTARADLEGADVTAPFDGVVTATDAAEGQIVSPGQTIGSLVRDDVARVSVGLADAQVQALGDPMALVGRPVSVRRTDGDGALLRRGRIVNIDPRLDEAARTTNFIVDVPDPFSQDPPLRLGQLVAVALPLVTPRALTALPVQALREGDAVWVVGDDGTLARRTLAIVHRTDTRAYAADGGALRGRRVMLTDLAVPAEGQRVRVAEGDDAPAAAGEAAAEAGG